MTNKKAKGTEATRIFYDNEGWQENQGKTIDNHLFGVKEDGPIRQELHQLHLQRIRSALSLAGKKINLLECGCGGNPATMLLDLCSEYTGIDFSEKGIEVAKLKLENESIPCELKVADICQLPFKDGQFDAVYSAHMLYHIEDPSAQKAALQEMLRVTKPNGLFVLIIANPRPLLFPIRLVNRLVADLPFISSIANRLRPKALLPYKPMPLGWIKRQLNPHGSVEIVTGGLPSTDFNQRISEYKSIGKSLWSAVKWLEIKSPKTSAYFGNYVQITVVKNQ